MWVCGGRSCTYAVPDFFLKNYGGLPGGNLHVFCLELVQISSIEIDTNIRGSGGGAPGEFCGFIFVRRRECAVRAREARDEGPTFECQSTRQNRVGGGVVNFLAGAGRRSSSSLL